MKPLFAVLAAGFLAILQATGAEGVVVPSGVSHGSFEKLLRKHVDERGLVDYGAWKKDKADFDALKAYLAQFEPKPSSPASGDERAAALINLYNASTIHLILENYPTDSIQSLKEPFAAKRLRVGGEMVSLNDIEHGSLRPLMGYRAHAVLVCAARSCPPLQRFGYEPGEVDEQIATAYRAWLAREDLNRFQPGGKKAEISSIFKWFKEDFDKAGGTRKVLAQYAPEKNRQFLSKDDYEIGYLPYNWGLNDQGAKGRGYSRLRLYWDRVADFVTFWN